MNENKFDLDRPNNADRNPVIVGVERIVTFGFVITAFSLMGNANTDLGTNPMNYYMAVWNYLYR